MITFVPAITLLTCTIFPATTAYPIFAKPVNAAQARCGGMFALHQCLPLQVSPVFNFRYGAFALLASSFTLALARPRSLSWREFDCRRPTRLRDGAA